MSGVTWSERQPGDWLASNGRWYPASKRPRGWSFLALPPAPGHGMAASIQRADGTSEQNSYSPPAATTHSPPPQGWSSQSASTPPPQPPPRPSSSSQVVQTGRRVAEATVTNVSTYKRRIGSEARAKAELPPSSAQTSGPPPPSPSQPVQPPPQSAAPGRVSKQPPPPARVASQGPPARVTSQGPPARVTSQGIVRTDPTVVAKASAAGYAGDFGRVLGKARKKLEDAINEAAQQDR